MKLRFLAALLIPVLGATASAQTVSLQPTADALLSAANPTSNYGGAGALSVAASGLTKGEFDSLLRFDLSSAKSNFDAFFGSGAWTIQSITLTLTATAPNNALFNGNGAGPGGSNVNFAGLFSLEWLQNDSWVEGSGTPSIPGATGVTYNDLASLTSAADEALGTFSFNGATTGSTGYQLALTPSFTADAAAGNMVTFLAESADTGVAMLVNSRTGSINGRPTLTIAAVPEPGTALLMLTGALLWCGRRSRGR